MPWVKRAIINHTVRQKMEICPVHLRYMVWGCFWQNTSNVPIWNIKGEQKAEMSSRLLSILSEYFLKYKSAWSPHETEYAKHIYSGWHHNPFWMTQLCRAGRSVHSKSTKYLLKQGSEHTGTKNGCYIKHIRHTQFELNIFSITKFKTKNLNVKRQRLLQDNVIKQ